MSTRTDVGTVDELHASAMKACGLDDFGSRRGVDGRYGRRRDGWFGDGFKDWCGDRFRGRLSLDHRVWHCGEHWCHRDWRYRDGLPCDGRCLDYRLGFRDGRGRFGTLGL